MTQVFIRSEYNYDADEVSLQSGLRCEDPSLTKQSFAEECDINTIVQRFNLTGEIPNQLEMPQYVDFEEVFDYHSAMNIIAAAHEQFEKIPAKIRAMFNNDPGTFMEFVEDEKNQDKLVELGLAQSIKKPDTNQGSDAVEQTLAGSNSNQPDGKSL